NEMAVRAFLDRRIPFVKISEVIGRIMEIHSVVANPELSDIIEADRWARKIADELMSC
ncbi:MAG: 1-deoxy-D-xylulose-5-phosphate reductoisomerase, partial [Desulfobacteraceae bacterium]|nr:1-deoxy-D-xylulose-5-phosphate reductoisomerase [Desulfobacteraceae bacterium]